MSRSGAADPYRRYSESNASGVTREPRTAREAYTRSRDMANDRLARPPRPGQPQQQNRRTTAQAEEELAEYDMNYKDMERELQMQEKQNAEQLKEFQERAQAEVQEKMARLDQGLHQVFERQMLDMETRYNEHSTQRIRTKSTDVLRVNKVLREIGRGLGPDWRPVFRILVKQVPLDVVEKKLKVIERQKPFIQAYKALTEARDLAGEEFEIFSLVDALKDCDKYELAERTLDILDSEGDELFRVGSFGQPIVSGSYDVEEGEGTANGYGEGATNGQSEADAGGPLADRKLLQLSKKMGPRWEQLAALLEVSEEDINDIKESDADENQTNFKLIWGWRETVMSNKSEEEAVELLKKAFKEMDRNDLAAMLEE